MSVVEEDICPYGCDNGMLFSPLERKLVPCPHCKGKKKDIARGVATDSQGRGIQEILRIPKTYTGVEYDFNITVPDRNLISAESQDAMRELLDGLLNRVTIGECPKFSCYINLGRNSDILNYVYTYLCTAYKAGLEVLPLVSTTDIKGLRSLAEGNESEELYRLKEELGVSYFDLERRSICVITIDASVTLGGIYTIKGLLEARSRRGLATLVFTNHRLSANSRSAIISEYSKCQHLLTPYEVVYKSGELEASAEVYPVEQSRVEQPRHERPLNRPSQGQSTRMYRSEQSPKSLSFGVASGSSSVEAPQITQDYLKQMFLDCAEN